MQKRLILIRHAHRDNSRREVDNGLDEKGKEQAKNLKRFFSDRFSREEIGRIWLVSSPKVRCVETLEPIGRHIERPVDVHPALNEQQAKETGRTFADRISGFVKEWRESKAELTCVCSHGDWLPMATHQIFGHSFQFKKGSWLELVEMDGTFEVCWFIPSFRAFY